MLACKLSEPEYAIRKIIICVEISNAKMAVALAGGSECGVKEIGIGWLEGRRMLRVAGVAE